MKSVFGKNIIFSLFGESHSEFIGLTINGLPSGIKINYDFINSELKRRRPNGNNNTLRIEEDNYKFISGIFNDYTTGAPLTVIIPNDNYDSSTFEEGVCRPGQSDYASYMSCDGFNDYRSGGHLSGRLTAPIVIGGAICKSILAKFNIAIESNVEYKLEDKEDETSGGIILCKASGIKAGIGEPFFDSVESILSHLFFSIPSVKAIEFGLGKDFAFQYGSNCIDEMSINDGKVNFKHNYNGGINGGLTNGNTIVCHITFKPIASINKTVNTINIKTKENIKYINKGKNDKNILNRSLVITESMMAIGLLDLLYSYNGRNSLK